MPAATAPTTQKQSLFAALHSLADDIRRDKQAAVKTAGPTPSDPGGYQGSTTHPVKNVDNNVQDATEGSRSSENTADVKKEIGEPSVDSTPEAKNKDGSGDQDSAQLNIGTTQSATGEDPSVEDDYKGTKDDPGTTHPAKTEDGEKYGSVKFAEAKKRANILANEILADLANGFGTKLIKVAGRSVAPAKVAPGSAAPAPTSAAPAKTAAAGATTNELLKKAAAAVQSDTPQAAAMAAGYELAAAMGIDKTAAMQGVADSLEQTIHDARIDADLLGSFWQRSLKQAADGEDAGEGEDHDKPGDAASGAGEGEPSGDAGGGSLGDMLGGGADPGGLAGAGGAGDAMGGGMGGAPGGGPGGAGGVSQEQALQELVAALDELGIPIEALAQLAGGGGGGAPPEAGGMPGAGGDPLSAGGPPPGAEAPGLPPGGMGAGGGAPPMSEGMKLASAAMAFRRSGKYRFKEAADNTRERVLREEMKSYVLDVIRAAQQ